MNSSAKFKLAILISGKGSNMRVIIEKCKEQKIPANVTVVFSDKADAPGLKTAKEFGVDTLTFSPKEFNSFDEYETRLADSLHKYNPDLIICAGYMRILKNTMLTKYKGKLINIHPSLLPAFPGLNAQKQALEYGAQVSGCTIHFVDEGVDSGPVILQGVTRVEENDTVETLSQKISRLEHELYWQAITKVLSGYTITGRKVIFTNP